MISGDHGISVMMWIVTAKGVRREHPGFSSSQLRSIVLGRIQKRLNHKGQVFRPNLQNPNKQLSLF